MPSVAIAIVLVFLGESVTFPSHIAVIPCQCDSVPASKIPRHPGHFYGPELGKNNGRGVVLEIALIVYPGEAGSCFGFDSKRGNP